MVNGRRPPPPSPTGLREISSRAKDYSGRPSEVTSELDELRNRGIAKGLNRHFTDTTKRIAKEKAAADAALADLERRRANKSEFVPSRGGELHPFDSMYVELQQKRAECRRKEKETMLLYQRYVHKYGKKAKVAAPSKEDLKAINESTPNDISSSAEKAPTTGVETSSTPKDASAPNDGSATKSAPASKDVPGVATTETSSSPPASPSKAAMPPVDETSESVDQEVNFSKFYNKQLSVRGREGADPPADPPGMVGSPDPPETQVVSDPLPDLPDLNQLTPQTSAETETIPSTREEEKASPVESSENKVSKPDPEEGGACEASRLSDSSDNSNKRPTALVTTEMPSATTATDDDDSDDRSVISGLTTANSVYTRQMMDEIETEMEDFLKTETLAVQQMLEREEEYSMSMSRSSFNMSGTTSVFGDESVRVAIKAEAMAREMQKILDDFQKDDRSVSIQSESHAEASQKEDEASVATTSYPRKFSPAIPGEEWMVYFDTKNQREYFYEKISNRTQWHPPTQSGMSEEAPETQKSRRRSSRKEKYRRKIRKRRNRRIFAFCLVALCGVATYFHWQTNHPEKTYPEAMKATLNNIRQFDLQEVGVRIKDKYEYTFTDRREREETLKQKLKREREEKARREEEERKAREKAEKERRRQEELLAEQRAKEEAQREAEAKRLAQEEALRREREAAELREAELRMSAQREEMRRPWGCNLPLAYVVNRRCRKLAKLNPMYDENALANSFLL